MRAEVMEATKESICEGGDAQGEEENGFARAVRERVALALRETAALPENRRKREEEQADLAAASDACWAVAKSGAMVLVGGEAINRTLPGGGVYGDEEHRDFDFISSSSSKLAAANMMRAIRDKGLDANIHPAVHEGTWTVKVHRRVVADVTEATHQELQALARRKSLKDGAGGDPTGPPAPNPGGRRRSRRGIGRRHSAYPLVAPVEYLKMSLHFELSRPTVHCRRWPRLHRRLRALYDAFPTAHPGGRDGATSHREAPGGLLEAALRSCRGSGGRLLLCGVHAAREMLGSAGVPAGSRVDLVLHTDDDTDTLAEAIRLSRCSGRELGETLITDGPTGASLFLPAYSSVTDTLGRELARVFSSPVPLATAACGWIASVDFVLCLMYGEDLAGGVGRATARAAALLSEEMLRREDSESCDGHWDRMRLRVEPGGGPGGTDVDPGQGEESPRPGYAGQQ